jgi:hypothetical protein
LIVGMGAFGSSGVVEVPTLLRTFGPVFDLDQFIRVRNRGDPCSLRKSILSIASDMSRANVELRTAPSGKCCFITCNGGDEPGSLVDCATVANYLKRVGFSVHFVHNPPAARYLELVKCFARARTETTVLYYNGTAETIKAGPADDDGRDEVLTFAGGDTVTDDELAAALADAASKLVIINESSHSGNVWNLRGTSFCGYALPPRVLSLASRRKGRGPQDDTSAGHEDAGLFTFLLFRLLNDNQGIRLNELMVKMNGYMSRYAQFLIATATSDDVLAEPVLPAWVPRQRR